MEESGSGRRGTCRFPSRKNGSRKAIPSSSIPRVDAALRAPGVLPRCPPDPALGSRSDRDTPGAHRGFSLRPESSTRNRLAFCAGALAYHLPPSAGGFCAMSARLLAPAGGLSPADRVLFPPAHLPVDSARPDSSPLHPASIPTRRPIPWPSFCCAP
jgi:hypothetical protein